MKIIKTVLLLGSGALKIGEAGEFDYSGTQAIKALKEEGKRVLLVNPNIATIQTSEGLADENYFVPVTPEYVEKVIEKEKPDAIMLSFGGQTALNCGMALHTSGILKKHNVEILGTPIQAVVDTEDRKLFAEKLATLGCKAAKGRIVKTLSEARSFAKETGYPVMLRTGFALGGTGSGVIQTEEILITKVTAALAIFPQLILEESLYGWKEVEYEVVRDRDDNCVTVCNMENFDPTGIHTGESIVVAPSQTLSNEEYYFLRETAIKVIRAFGIIGECNIQYALHPTTGDYRIIEVNARLSRSSALASKATGYPLAYIAAKLALGKRLWEIPNSVTSQTTAFFEPSLDYIATKMPRWDIEKFDGAESTIGSEMKSVGEVLSIGRSFEESIQKAARMLSDGYTGVVDSNYTRTKTKITRKQLTTPSTLRLFYICTALYQGMTIEQIARLTAIDRWFLAKLAHIVDVFKQLEKAKTLDTDLLTKAKQTGFSDLQIATLRKTTEEKIRALRISKNITPVVKQIDTLAAEFPAHTNYLYLTYNAQKSDHRAQPKEKKVIVVGSGPYAIGTSVEFDWCAVNTVLTARKNGYKAVVINCNPETVSTDFDYSDYLYFEELSLERVRDIYEIEKSPFILSVGGQIPNNLSQKFAPLKIPILGPQPAQITQAEHREAFSRLLDSLNIAQPPWARAKTTKEAFSLSSRIGYPVLLRPSFVLSGKAMRVIRNENELSTYMKSLELSLSDHPLLITKYFENASECDFDGVAQNGSIVFSAISEHVEGAGVHSGDSSLIFPSRTIPGEQKERLTQHAARIVKKINLSGPFNIQFILHSQQEFVIECNLRASRSFPFISKVSGINAIDLASRIALGINVKPVSIAPHFYGVKVPQFSYHKLKGADPVLKVEMNSTGEVAAISKNVDEAYLTALIATGVKRPSQKAAFISLGDASAKSAFLSSALTLVKAGYTLFTTAGTRLFLKDHMIETKEVAKINEGRGGSTLDLIKAKKIDFIVNVVSRGPHETALKKQLTDGAIIRRAAIDYGIHVFTSCDSAIQFVRSLHTYPSKIVVNSLQTMRKEHI